MNKSNLLIENDYILKSIYKALPYLIDGMTVLVRSQQTILSKILENNNSSNEDSLEISLALEEINNKINSLSAIINNQEESNEELNIDILQIKQLLSDIENKIKE